MFNIYENSRGLRVIKTARSEYAINIAAKKGFWPLVKPVIPSAKIRGKFSVLQDNKTGLIKVVSDYRSSGGSEMSRVIGFTDFYPYHFESPYAAYLIPQDLKVGETVWIEDLIEDLVGSRWNQGDTRRVASCEAIWDGKDLVVQYVEIKGDTVLG